MTLQRRKELIDNSLSIFFRHWLPVIMSVAGGIMFGAMRFSSVEERLARNILDDSKHHDDKELHVPHWKQTELFVTREEFNHISSDMHKDIDQIDVRQREILTIVTKLETEISRRN